MAYLKNSILDFENRQVSTANVNDSKLQNFEIEDYFSLDLSKMLDYIETCDEDMFDWYQMQNNTAIEKIAYDLYGNADYWDILITINNKNPLFDMPYDFDTLSNMAESKTNEYINKYFGGNISEYSREVMQEHYTQQYSNNSDKLRVIRIVKPNKIHAFIQKGYEMGCFK